MFVRDQNINLETTNI